MQITEEWYRDWWLKSTAAAMRAQGVDPDFAEQTAPAIFEAYSHQDISPVEAVLEDMSHWNN